MAPKGEFLTEGDTLYQLQLADTLEAIAEQGTEYFYNSNFTVEMVNELQQNYGSILTVEDFRRYTVIERQIVPAKFKDHIMLSMPPPASGAILGLLLNTLDGMYRLSGLIYMITVTTLIKLTTSNRDNNEHLSSL